MKKSRIIFYALLAMLTFTACTSEVDDVFDKSSADRISEAIATDKQMLVDAPNGWLMEYFCEETYGGYNMFVKFNADNTVTVANEVYGASARATSHYKLEQSKGVLLSFDEYNNLFHFFSDPANPLGIGDNGKGMRGDFEFRVISAEADRFELQGKKHGAKVVMTRVAEDVDWDEYINDVLAMEENVSFGKYNLSIADSEPIQLSAKYRTFTYHDAENDKDVTAPFIITTTGIKFYKPVTINDVTMEELNFNADTDQLVSGDGVVVLTPVVPPISELFLTGNWLITYDNIGPWGKPYFDFADNKLLETEGENLVYACLSKGTFIRDSYNDSWGFTFYVNTGYAGQLTMTTKAVADDKVSMVFAMAGQGDGVYYHNNCGFNYYLTVFGYSTARVFTLTADNPNNPTEILLVEDANPDNWIKVTSNVVTYK